MYHHYWNLAEPPFHARTAIEGFYQTPQHEEALARLEFLTHERRRLGLLLAPAGHGKSLLLEVFERQLVDADQPVARVHLTGVEPDELPLLLADAFCLPPGADQAGRGWRRLNDYFAEQRCLARAVTILLDDADRTAPRTRDALGRLLHTDASRTGHLTLVLASTPRRAAELGESLLESAELRVDLGPWSLEEVIAYLPAAVRRAGGSASLFEPAAAEALHRLSQGAPRRLNQLADLALLAGASRHAKTIDADTIEAVYDELQVHPVVSRR